MRFAEVNDRGRVRYVLPPELASEYTVLPPNSLEIALDADVSEGDVPVYDAEGNLSFRAQTVEENAAEARPGFDAERNRLFTETEWVRQRHADRLELVIDDAANWTAWLNYWQALRNMPQQEEFDPASPAWPEKPE